MREIWEAWLSLANNSDVSIIETHFFISDLFSVLCGVLYFVNSFKSCFVIFSWTCINFHFLIIGDSVRGRLKFEPPYHHLLFLKFERRIPVEGYTIMPES